MESTSGAIVPRLEAVAHLRFFWRSSRSGQNSNGVLNRFVEAEDPKVGMVYIDPLHMLDAHHVNGGKRARGGRRKL